MVWTDRHRPVYRLFSPAQSACLSQAAAVTRHCQEGSHYYQVMAGGIKIVSEANLSCQHSMDRPEPMARRTFINLDTSTWSGGVATVMPQGQLMESVQAVAAVGRMMKEEHELDPDEEEKRRVRRERNKLAAARCRKRRVEQIEGLQREVDDWEDKKRMLQEEISSLQAQREDLQFILDAHSSHCKKLTGQGPRVLVKSEPEQEQSYSDHLTTSESMEALLCSGRPPRPVSLSLKTVPLRNIEGVSIDTPSSGISLNFDSLMEGRTGLTPTNVLAPININLNTLGPSCASQQRNGLSSISAAMTELSSPSSSTPNLVSL